MQPTGGVPHILHQVVSTRSRELFVITIILLCLGTALLTSQFGLSLALGAFLAGIVISESEYASQAISDILPFKESFTGIFFISIGMLMDIWFLRSHFISILSVVLVILILKIITVAISASVLTMILTPFMVSASPALSLWLVSRTLFNRFQRIHRRAEREGFPRKKAGHVIIIGFGLNGRNLARVLRESGIPYVILDLNNSTVRRMKKEGEPIYYGDGTSVEILHKLGIHTAKSLVIAISDAPATRRIVQIARKENPELYIIVRTRYTNEVDHLISLGANEVIPEEFETSIEIFSRVLHHYHTPRNVITEHIETVRKDCYSVLRSVDLPRKGLAERYELLKEIETETYLIKDSSRVAGKSLKELNLRVETGATIIAIQRGDTIHHNPPSNFILKEKDIIVFIGKKEEIDRATAFIEK